MKDLTLKDVADAAGVSPAVVSRVKNGDTTLRISKETLDRVKQVIHELDFEPNSAARSLRSARSGLIAVVVHDISNAVYAEIIRGLQAGANKANMAILLADAESASSRLLELVGGGGVDGLILLPAGKAPDQMLTRAARSRLPIVFLQARLDPEARLVALPDESAAHMATEHLLSLGHRDVACIATAPGLSFTQDRVAGWRRALDGVVPTDVADRIFYTEQSGVAEGRAAAQQLLWKFPSVSGIVCLNPLVAIGALQSAKDLGLTVPNDVSVVSVHDLSYAAQLSVPLTTVATPLFELGEKAVDVLLDQHLASNCRAEIAEPAPYVIQRGSTSRPSVWARAIR